MNWSSVIAVAVGLLPALTVQTASPCSPSRCVGPTFVPNRGIVPANLTGAFWNPSEDRAASFQGDWNTRLRLLHAVGTGIESVPYTLEEVVGTQRFLVRFGKPLVMGDHYRLEETGTCADKSTTTAVDFIAGPSADVPVPDSDSLGRLSVGDTDDVDRDVFTSDGSCTNEVSGVAVRVRLHLSGKLEPWIDVLSHHVNLDRDGLVGTAFHICGGDTRGTSDNGAKQTIEWSATIPGLQGSIAAPSVKVDLSCGLFSGCEAGQPTTASIALAIVLLLRRRGRRKAKAEFQKPGN